MYLTILFVAFSWKERLALKLPAPGTKRLEFKARPQGTYETDLKPFLDPARGDYILDVTNMESATLTSPEPSPEGVGEMNFKKRLIMPLLFGSSKPFGMIKRKDSFRKERLEYRKDRQRDKRGLTPHHKYERWPEEQDVVSMGVKSKRKAARGREQISA